MKLLLPMVLFTLALLPLAAKDAVASPASGQRAYFGVVASELAVESGLRVGAVAQGSPADKAGIRAGDCLLRVGQASISSREDLRRVVAEGRPGQVLVVKLQREGKPLVLRVVLLPRPSSAARVSRPEAAVGADRHVRPIDLPDSIRQEIRRHRRLLRQQLASLPDGLEPAFVTEELNAIRNLARDAHASRPGWMAGRAGEISVRFRDAEGSVVLYGANNLISLELYDTQGQLTARYDLNTEAERRALPAPVLSRLQRLR